MACRNVCVRRFFFTFTVQGFIYERGGGGEGGALVSSPR